LSDDDDAPDAPEPSDEEILAQVQFDAGEPTQVKRRERKAALQEREARQFWERIFATELGRREMFKLLRDCKAFETEFACGPNGFPQPEATWFKAGQSDWGRRMRETWLVQHTDAFALMLRENDPRFQKGSK
jgi:hypothetical protein